MLILRQESREKSESIEKSRREILEKDAIIREQRETIENLQQQVATFETRLAAAVTPKSSRRKQVTPRNLELQSDCRTLIAKKASEGKRYDYSLSFNSPVNVAVTESVCKSYKDLNTENCNISGNEMIPYCHTYFKNAKQYESRKERGVNDENLRRARSRSRKQTKLDERLEAVKLAKDFTPEELELLELGKVLVETIGMDGVSSEEDPCDSENDETPTTDRGKRKRPQGSDKVRRVFPFYWESPKLRRVKETMDGLYDEQCVKEAHRSKRWIRVRDSSCKVSRRPPPKNAPDWMLNDEGKQTLSQ